MSNRVIDNRHKGNCDSHRNSILKRKEKKGVLNVEVNKDQLQNKNKLKAKCPFNKNEHGLLGASFLNTNGLPPPNLTSHSFQYQYVF